MSERSPPKLPTLLSRPTPRSPACSTPAYAELQVTSNFSFLQGASHPEELVQSAAQIGYRAIAITDRNSLAGIVRAHRAATQPMSGKVIQACVAHQYTVRCIVHQNA